MVLLSCEEGPKVTDISKDNTEMESNEKKVNQNSSANDMHLVTVKEIIPATKYVYLFVEEGDKEYWLATGLKDIQLKKQYVYKGALYKTNFESKELNRVFDEIYLVSNLLEDSHGSETSKSKTAEKGKIAYPSESNTIDENAVIEGSMKISELTADPQKFEGKTVQLSGTIVKVNENIMKMNWLHIQDGSDNDYDLVITTNQMVLVDEFITIKAVVTLDKDFGAGYHYDLILENGVIVE